MVETLARMLYRTADRRLSWAPAAISEEMNTQILDVEAALERLLDLGLLVPSPTDPSGYSAVRPDAALSRLLALEEDLTGVWHQQLADHRQRVNSLLREFPLPGTAGGSVHVEMLPTPSKIHSYLEDRLDGILTQELAMHPGGVPPLEYVDDMLLRDMEVLTQGVKVQGLYARHLTEVAYMRDYLTEVAHHGADIRVSDYLPLRMILIDQDLAILPLDPQDTSRGAFAVQSEEISRSLHTIFAHHWAMSLPLDECFPDAAPEEPLGPQGQTIARMLAIGMKDDAIARQLGISKRTFSRAISKLLQDLGVQTRFEAGAKLVRAGMLDSPIPLPKPDPRKDLRPGIGGERSSA
ncbi:LuxR C-terminal-related transcriptional regulator [Kitasatospora sp. NPDC056138]|uniref:helix-turn-helix transcriptional regulator n=1 Tax=Kitasatospora sp. NPDC056138 TaxID=3345724 RepID=UPI0035DDE18B